jgi:malate dehydrogenase (oxaloacetate-decarboxylating)(NADP+)
MRLVYEKLKEAAPNLMMDGEMQGDVAINAELRERYVPDSVLKGEANLLIFPNLDAANLSMTLLKDLNNALPIGPILMGTRQPAHILVPSVTSRGIVNMAAIAASEAQASPRGYMRATQEL